MPRILSVLALCASCFLSACAPDVFIRKSIDDAAVQAQASKNAAVQWRAPLGVSVVEDMQALAGNYLLLALKHDDDLLSNGKLILVDRNRGQVKWSYDRPQKFGDYSFLQLTEKTVLIRNDSEQHSTLLALDIDNGQVMWQRKFDSTALRYFPVLNAGTMVALEQDKTSVKIDAIDVTDGRIKWSKKYSAVRDVPAPVLSTDSIWLFYDGIEKIDGRSGKRLWQRTDISLGEFSPLPQWLGNALYSVDDKHQLQSLSANSGKTLATFNIDKRYRVTNIYPSGNRIYLRGVVDQTTSGAKNPEEDIKLQVRLSVQRAMGFSGADGHTHVLLAMSATNGKALWKHESPEASVSNLVETKSTLYHATASRLIALDHRTGKPKFNQVVTNAGRNYPVHIRLLNDNIIYLGEWIVAAYDSRSGKQQYRHGMNPVPNGGASMSGLDDGIKRLQQQLGQNSPTSQGIAASMSQEAARYQNQANLYSSQASSYRSLSRSSSSATTRENYYWKSFQARNSAQISSEFSKAFSSVSMAMSVWELNAQLSEAFRQSSIKSNIAHAQLYRKAILGGFATAESRDHYYRPHNNLNGLVGLSVINLQNGKRRDIMLSPKYQDYGIWNFVDLDKGVIYHHGIGMDTRAHNYVSQSRGLGTFMIYESFLLAQPVKLP